MTSPAQYYINESPAALRAALAQDIPPLWVPLGTTGAEAAAIAASGGVLSIVNPGYVPGNLLRYGLVPNNVNAGATNAAILKALFTPTVANGPTGLFWLPNTTGADIYTVGDFWQLRYGVQLDLMWSTLSLTKTGVATDSLNSWIFALGDVIVQNGFLAVNYQWGGGAVNAGAAIGLGCRGAPVAGSALPTVTDSALPRPMGNVVLRNLIITSNTVGGMGMYTIGGLQNVRIENVWIDGGSALAYGIYNEFGFATGPTAGTSRSQAQTSHSHDWFVTNYKVTNLQAGISSYAFASNGGYGMTFDGLTGSNLGGLLQASSGESLFFRPWVGQDDWGSVAPNGRWFTVRNAKGRVINGSAISVAGNSCGTTVVGFNAWLPATAYTIGNVVYNGSNRYTCASNGTSNAALPGPTGTGAGIADGTTSWNFTSSFTNSGYLGWRASTTYSVGDVAFNGQFYYQCTTGGLSSANQGPIGTGAGIVDNVARWTSLGSAWPLETEQLNLSVDGIVADGGGGGTGYGVRSSCGITVVRNFMLTGFADAVVTETECTEFSIEDGKGLNNQSAALILGLANQVYTPPRFATGRVVRNFFAGSGTGGSNVTAISAAQIQALKVEGNRFGYELIHDGVAEATQLQAINAGASCSNVICDDNYIAAVAGGTVGYTMAGGVSSNGNKIRNASGVQTTTGNWITEFASATSPATGAGGTIATQGLAQSRVTPAAAIAGVILQIGTWPNQEIVVVNEGAAASTITMAAAGTSHVADGVSCVIAGLTQKTFKWDASTALWYHS